MSEARKICIYCEGKGSNTSESWGLTTTKTCNFCGGRGYSVIKNPPIDTTELD